MARGIAADFGNRPAHGKRPAHDHRGPLLRNALQGGLVDEEGRHDRTRGLSFEEPDPPGRQGFPLPGVNRDRELPQDLEDLRLIAVVLQAKLRGNEGAECLPLPVDVPHLHDLQKGFDGVGVVEAVRDRKIDEGIDQLEGFREKLRGQPDPEDGSDVHQDAQGAALPVPDQAFREPCELPGGKAGEETGRLPDILPTPARGTEFFDEFPFIRRHAGVTIRHRL